MTETLDSLKIEIEVNAGNSKSEIESITAELSKLGNILKQTTQTKSSAASSFGAMSSDIRKFSRMLKNAAGVCGQWFNESNDYVEALNLFHVSMGNAAGEAEKFADSVSALLGIDLKEWMNYQGSFNQIFEGFGIADDKAAIMSQQLTQLSYDLSSYANIPVENAFKKIQSGVSGQIKGLKEFGLNLSVAQIRETALAHGITLSTAKMTEAQKAMLRYVTLMEQSINIQGDMARTIITPANAMRVLSAQMTVLKRTLGNIVSVFVADFIPVVQLAVVELTKLANLIANHFGWKIDDLGWDNVSDSSDYFVDLDDSLSDAEDTAKKLKKTLMGFDEINKLDDPTSSVTSDLLGGGLPSDLGLGIPTYTDKFLEGIALPDELKEKELKKTLSYVTAIGAGFAAWAVSITLVKRLAVLKEALKGLKKVGAKGFTFELGVFGVTKFLSDLKYFQEFFNDFLENGLTLQNGAGMVAEFTGMLSDAFIALGKTKLGGALGIIQGLGEITSGIADMVENCPNWDNVTLIVRGLSNLAGAISLLKGNYKAAGIFEIVSGFTTVIREIGKNWEEIRKGNWSGVDKAALATAAIQILGGVFVAVKGFSKIAKAAKVTEAVPALKDVSKTTTELSNTTKDVSTSTSSLSETTSALTSKLKSLIKNLALGLVVIVEVAAAALLVVGAVWLLGKELEQVGIAWNPVVDNGETILIAMGLGVAVLAAVGVVTGLLGSAGSALILSMGIGIAVLAEIGVSAVLLLAEICVIGKALEQIGIAWQPVIDNGETIKNAILLGTALLVGVGTVTALLGAASVASVGLLPLAIAAGTALLAELSASFIIFISNLETVANKLSYRLHPALVNLNSRLPVLTKNMENFTGFMEDFASQVASYSKSSFIVGFGSTVTTIIDLFTKDPISTLANDVSEQYNQTKTLNDRLKIANPELKIAIDLIKQYYTFLEEIERLTGKSNNISLAKGMFVSMKEVGKNLVTGFVSGMGSQNAMLSRAVKSVLRESFSGSLAYNYGYDFGRSLADGISNAIRSASFPELKSHITSNGSGIASMKIRAYASGGFPDTGGLFVAREAGPELVGRIGRRSAVANNDQIVASVEGGVYRAVCNAMQSSNSANPNNRIVVEQHIYLDGQEITDNVVKHHNNAVKVNGASPLLVGV